MSSFCRTSPWDLGHLFWFAHPESVLTCHLINDQVRRKKHVSTKAGAQRQSYISPYNYLNECYWLSVPRFRNLTEHTRKVHHKQVLSGYKPTVFHLELDGGARCRRDWYQTESPPFLVCFFKSVYLACHSRHISRILLVLKWSCWFSLESKLAQLNAI